MATVFSIKEPNPGVWFKFDDNDAESGEIRIRFLNAAKREEIRKKTTTHRVEYKHGQRFTFDDTKDDLFSEMLWSYSIVEWVNLTDDEGVEIKCTDENKVFLMQNNVGFAHFVNNCMSKLVEIDENRVSIVEKNLQSGSHGSGKSQIVKPAKN